VYCFGCTASRIKPTVLTTRSACKDIISRLLDKEESTRLGSKTGASEVKQHKWFSKISWGLLRNTEPPVSRTIWVVRLTTVVYRFVNYVSPRLWPWSQHMLPFQFSTRSLVNHKFGADLPVFGRLFRSSLHHQTERTR
jgi:hypothetical protein